MVDSNYINGINIKLPSFVELVNMNKNYVMTWILFIPLFSYLYFIIFNAINKKKNNIKKKKYIGVIIFVVCLILLGVLFILGHEFIMNNIERFYHCSDVC